MDLSAITGAVDLTAVTAAVLAIAALKMMPSVARWASARIVSLFGR